MVAIRNEAIGYINDLPADKLIGALEYLKLIHGKKHPLEITSKEEMYRKIDEGLNDIETGRVRPFEEAMSGIMDGLQKRIAEA